MEITKIELREIAQGYRLVDGVEEIVPFPDHKKLFGDWGPGGSMRQIGYVFFKPKQTINCACVRCSPDVLAEIHRLVEAETGLKFDGIGHKPEEELEDEDEDEEVDDDEA